MPRRLSEIRLTRDQPTAIETTFKIVKEHTTVEESMPKYYVDLSQVVSNNEAFRITQRLIEDEKSHHRLLGKLTSDIQELYGSQLALDSEN